MVHSQGGSQPTQSGILLEDSLLDLHTGYAEDNTNPLCTRDQSGTGTDGNLRGQRCNKAFTKVAYSIRMINYR